jgi:hypothetical protein
MIRNHWLSIAHKGSEPLAQHISPSLNTTGSVNTTWFTATESVQITMVHDHWLSQTFHDLHPLAKYNAHWFTVTGSAYLTVIHSPSYAEPVVVKHCVLCGTSASETLCVMLRQWLWVIVCYANQVVVKHCVLCWASDCESSSVILSDGLWITVRYAEPVTVNQCALYLASGIHSHWLSITHHDSQPLAQNSTTWFIAIRPA